MCLRTSGRAGFCFSLPVLGALSNGAGIVLKHLLSEVSFILVKRWVRPPSFYKGEMGMAHDTCVLESGNALDPKQQSFPRE